MLFSYSFSLAWFFTAETSKETQELGRARRRLGTKGPGEPGRGKEELAEKGPS